MKQANFKLDSGYRGIICGTVTQKDDGKISISLENANYFSGSTRDRARDLAKKIVESDFNHEAIYNYREVIVDVKLKKHIIDSTQLLLEQYLEKTAKYCQDKWRWVEERRDWSNEKWVELFPQKLSNPYKVWKDIDGQRQQVLIETSLSKLGLKIKSEVNMILSIGYEKFLENEIKYANEHYNSSINKLVDRLQNKGISVCYNNFKIEYSSLGVNFEMTIKHEDGTITRAYTIIAEGPIQRPHYRFLVK
jgi:hypothetical protein